MKIIVLANLNPLMVLRRSGYGLITNQQTKETSFVRRLGQNFYPRFHAYINDREINLHLDQKQPSYRGQKAHSGEYDGEVVAGEAERIKGAMERLRENNNQ